MEHVKRLLKKTTRLKTISETFHHTELRKCLTTFDLTLLGIGHMVGSGIYVLTGTIVKTKAGPSAVLSYLFSGLAALLSALCYAEFGARVPKAGSAYSYTYVTIGEIWGFLVGWNLILETLLGVASIARSWSGTVDSLFNGAIRNGTLEYLGYLAHDNEWISDYPDFLAAGITIVISLVVVAGAKQSVMLNSVFTVLNMIVIVFILCFGFSHADVAYWTDSHFGGFFPFGFSGTLSAAASCFYAYIGFEGIAVASEESLNPAKSIPLATVVAMTVVMVTYMSATSALTLMVPYDDVSLTAAFPEALERVGVMWAKYLVAVGTLLGISCSLLGGAFTMPRNAYAMASDGLLFRCLGNVNPVTHTPITSTLLFGTVAATMALILSMETLVEFLSVGTLFVYTIVAANLIILRYSPDERFQVKRNLGPQYSSVDPIEITLTVEKLSENGCGDFEEKSSCEIDCDKTDGRLFCEDDCDEVGKKSWYEIGCDKPSEELVQRHCSGNMDEKTASSNGCVEIQEKLTCPKSSDENDDQSVLFASSGKNSEHIHNESQNSQHNIEENLQESSLETPAFLQTVGGIDPSKRYVGKSSDSTQPTGSSTESALLAAKAMHGKKGHNSPKMSSTHHYKSFNSGFVSSAENVNDHVSDGNTSYSDSLSQDTERIPIMGKTTRVHKVGGLRPRFRQVPVLKDLSPGKGVSISLGCLIVLLLALAVVLNRGVDLLAEGQWWVVIVFVLLVVCIVFFTVVIVMHEQNSSFSTFQMPLVPYLPVVSILVNLMLMMSLSPVTWLRLLLWIILGLLLYFSYGLHHSQENENSSHSSVPLSKVQLDSDSSQEKTTDDNRALERGTPAAAAKWKDS